MAPPHFLLRQNSPLQEVLQDATVNQRVFIESLPNFCAARVVSAAGVPQRVLGKPIFIVLRIAPGKYNV